MTAATPALELTGAGKTFGNVIALRDITLSADPGSVTCVLGDNGAGKSTLIKILSGVHRPSSGELRVNGEPVSFSSPRDALARGIATVYQDLATVPLMSGVAQLLPRQRTGIEGRFPVGEAGEGDDQEGAAEHGHRPARSEPADRHALGRRTPGRRGIARAVHFGAKVLILDEPTSALGVRQSGIVLKYVLAARARGRGRVHHPQPAPRVHGRRSVLPPRPRAAARRLRAGEGRARRPHPRDGRRQRADLAGPRDLVAARLTTELSRPTAAGSSRCRRDRAACGRGCR